MSSSVIDCLKTVFFDAPNAQLGNGEKMEDGKHLHLAAPRHRERGRDGKRQAYLAALLAIWRGAARWRCLPSSIFPRSRVERVKKIAMTELLTQRAASPSVYMLGGMGTVEFDL